MMKQDDDDALPDFILDEEPFVVDNHRLWVGALLAGATVLGTLSLMAPFVLTKSPLPYMATPGRKIRNALEFIHKHSKQSTAATSRTFVDLGSGDGEGVLQAAQSGYYQQAIGIELNWTLYALSRLRRQFFWNTDWRQKSHFLHQDFFPYSLAQAHTCLIFGVTPLMEPLSRKLAQECAPGTHVLAYRFALPLASPQNPTLLQAELVYDVEEMRVYKCL